MLAMKGIRAIPPTQRLHRSRWARISFYTTVNLLTAATRYGWEFGNVNSSGKGWETASTKKLQQLMVSVENSF